MAYNAALAAVRSKPPQLLVLRWLRERGCPWDAATKAEAEKLGYADNLGNVTEAPGGVMTLDEDGDPLGFSLSLDDMTTAEAKARFKEFIRECGAGVGLEPHMVEEICAGNASIELPTDWKDKCR